MQTNQTNNWQDQQALERYTAIAPLLDDTMDSAKRNQLRDAISERLVVLVYKRRHKKLNSL